MSSKPLNSVSIGEAFEIMSQIGLSSINNDETPPNIFLHGSMGLGKSSIIKGLKHKIEEMNKFDKVVLIDMRLSALDDPSSLMGIPYLPTEKNDDVEMLYSTPCWFPKHEDGTFYILFLDELPNAHPTIQQASYRLVLDRSLNNGKEMPKNVWTIAAGNLKGDNTGARDILPALANRFSLHLQIDKDRCVDDFISYAYANGIDPKIISFISYKRSALNGAYNNEPAFNTSRSWEMLSNNLSKLDNLPDNLVLATIAGTIGSALAIEFSAFLKFDHILPKWNDVRNGVEYVVPQSIAECYYVMTALSIELVTAMEDNDEVYINELSKIVKQLGTDHRVVLFKLIKSVNLSCLLKVLQYRSLFDLYKPISELVKQ